MKEKLNQASPIHIKIIFDLQIINKKIKVINFNG